MSRRRGPMAVVVAVTALAAMPATAGASFHEMLIQEIFPGSTMNPGEAYVTLQMYTPGQNLVDGHTLTVYEADGDIADTATFADDVDNGQSQATILIGAEATVVGVAPDLLDSGLAAMDRLGGAACWEDIDCVAWGTFTPPLAGLPSPAGTPISSPGSPEDGLRMVRGYQAGCSTTLDAVDDTDDGGDFALGLPVPRNNAMAPTEEACFNTVITGGPQGTTRNRTPRFKFASQPGGAQSFRCGIDDPDDTDTCTSPFTLPRQSLGKHKLFVEAVNSQNGEDPTPAKRAFKVVRRR